MKSFHDFERNLVEQLKKKHFIFVLNLEPLDDTIEQELQRAADGAHNSIYPLFYKGMTYAFGFPAGTEKLFNFLISEKKTKPLLGANEISAYFETLVREFDVRAFKFSHTWISFAAFLDCDRLSSDECVRKAEVFQSSARNLNQVIGGTEVSLAGITQGTEGYLIFATLCFVFESLESYSRLQKSVADIELKGDGVVGFFFRDVEKGAVFFDKMQYCLFSNELSSSAHLRDSWHYGFSGDDIEI